MAGDHNPYGFTIWLAGGGVKGGMIATILHLLGFDHTKLTHRFDGRDFRLTDVHGVVAEKILA